MESGLYLNLLTSPHPVRLKEKSAMSILQFWMYCIGVYLDSISLSGLLIVLVGLDGSSPSLCSGFGSGDMVSVRSGL